MLEQRLPQGGLLKKVLEAMRELITVANFDFSRSGIALQAMDFTHATLVALLLRADSFDHFRCDRNRSMGMNLNNLSKILRCAANDDAITLTAQDDGDTVSFIFENPIDGHPNEHLDIPEAQYQAIIKMSSQDFARICKDLGSIGDTVVISVTKEGEKFSTTGDIGSANIVCRQNITVDKVEYKIADMGYIRYYLAPKYDDQT